MTLHTICLGCSSVDAAETLDNITLRWDVEKQKFTAELSPKATVDNCIGVVCSVCGEEDSIEFLEQKQISRMRLKQIMKMWDDGEHTNVANHVRNDGNLAVQLYSALGYTTDADLLKSLLEKETINEPQ